jgi:hypothetical protein
MPTTDLIAIRGGLLSRALVHSTSAVRLNTGLPKALVLVFTLAVAAAAQDSNSIMGFETPFGWMVNSRASSTSIRTQGMFALELRGPASVTTLTSLPVASTALALAGIGAVGSVFEVDVTLPAQGGNAVNNGSLKLSISSPSAGLSNVSLGQVNFNVFRSGIYSTMTFPIPGSVRSALGGAAFNDLSFAFTLNLSNSAGSYLFDNLRVHSTPPAGTSPPPGYGGSLDFVVTGNTPVAQLFPIGVVQVPDSFHLKMGRARDTTADLAVGYDGTAAFTCDYRGDPSDPSGASYIFMSCTGGVQPGDLLAADWAQLQILGGDNSMQLRAQLAMNPVGDLLGAGIIPALPTFWGDFDGCVPAPQPGVIVTMSASCANQIAQANQIVTTFFNKVTSSTPPPDWIVTAVPEFALRHDNGASHHPQAIQPTRHDPPFDQEGHMNPGGSFDGYWRLNGDIETNNTATQSTAHFEANFSAHMVLFGEDVNVASLTSVADTSSGQGSFSTCDGTRTSPDAVGCLHMFLFGSEIPGGGTGNASTGFNFNLNESQNFDLPPIPIWIFSITLGATASVGVNATGKLAVTGFDVIVTPSASLGAHMSGSVNIVIASGGVDASVDLLDISTPVHANAGWAINILPQYCSSTLNLLLHGDAQISSGGGKVDLVAAFGPCPFCVHESWNLFKWGPLATFTQTLFDLPASVQLFELPTALCKQPLTVTISAPMSPVLGGGFYWLNGLASSPGGGGYADCNNFTWSLNPPPSVTGDQLSPPSGQGCNVSVVFAQPGPTGSSRTLTLSASQTIYDQFRTPIVETGSASENLTVTPLAPGPHITGFRPSPIDYAPSVPAAPPFENHTVIFQLVPLTAPLEIQLFGTVIGPTRGDVTDWTVTDSHGSTTDLGPGANVFWHVPAFDIYTIKMMTTAGTVMMVANVQEVPR